MTSATGLGEAPETPRALVIEDDDDVLHLLASHLRRLGFVVTTATNGEDGVLAARACAPDVVLVDIVLPGMDGHEVVRMLRTDAATAGCRLVVTSVLDPDDLAAVEADALLPKPFTRHDVARVLRSLGTVRRDAAVAAGQSR